MEKKFLNSIIEQKDGKIVAVATDESVDRDGDSLKIDMWDLKNYKRNPVIQAGHIYKPEFTIGKATNVRVEGSKLIFEPVFHEITQLAKEMGQMVKEGFLNTFSVGFIPASKNNSKNELLEISLVPVPANPKAQVIQRSIENGEVEVSDEEMGKIKEFIGAEIKIEEETELKSVVPFKSHELAPKGTAWNGPTEIKKAPDVATLKLMTTWYDTENADKKGAYKLPHHKAVSPNETVWRGVAAAMAALFGARGGVKIPDSDRKGVYNHLKKHYAEFDETAPEFRNYETEELFKMHQEGIIIGDELEIAKMFIDENKKEKAIAVLQGEKPVKNGEENQLKGRDPKRANKLQQDVILRTLQQTAKQINLALHNLKKNKDNG